MKTIGATVILLLIVGELIFIAATSRDTTAEGVSQAGIAKVETDLGESLANTSELAAHMLPPEMRENNELALGGGLQVDDGPVAGADVQVAGDTLPESGVDVDQTNVRGAVVGLSLSDGAAVVGTHQATGELPSIMFARQSQESSRGESEQAGVADNDGVVEAKTELLTTDELFRDGVVEDAETSFVNELFTAGDSEGKSNVRGQPQWLDGAVYEAVKGSLVQFVSAGSLIGNGVVVAVDESQGTVDVLTAAHVIDAATSFEVRFSAESEGKWLQHDRMREEPSGLWNEQAQKRIAEEMSELRKFRITSKDTALDLALVRVAIVADGSCPKPIQLSSRDVAELVDGSDEAKPLRVSWLEEKAGLEFEKLGSLNHSIVRREASAPEVGHWELSIESAAGMSGGPLFDSRGELIGIASGNSRGRGYYVDLPTIRSFLVRSKRVGK